VDEQTAAAGTAEGPAMLAVLDDQFKFSRFNGDARNQPLQLPAKRSANIKMRQSAFTQRLDKNPKMAPVNAVGSRRGPSWLTF
jgi:hypothetical protein